jgi:uncharacterized damage-inducible protein DinB
MRTSILADAFDHHVWATLRLLDACGSLTPEQLAATVPGTYGSIIDTLRHTVGGDRTYLWVLTAGELTEVDEEGAGLAELRAVMEEDGRAWSALLAADPDPGRVVVRHREDGSASAAPVSIRLAQALHHGTDHRSQVCTALTSLGMQPPHIDAWAFATEDGRLVFTPAGEA